MFLGCPVTSTLLQAWAERLVFPHEPILVTNSEREMLAPCTVVYTWEELRADHNSAPLDFWDSYNLYGVKRDGTEVALLSPRELRALPGEAQEALRRSQWERGRGQVYAPSAAPGDRVDTSAGPRNVLHYDTWTMLPREEQQRILLEFVSADNVPGIPYVSSDPVVAMLANTFASRSGPNCFATVLAAVTPSLETATTISELWLHPQPFIRGLTARGFAARDWAGEHQAGSVLVWYDGGGHPRHACYLLPDGLALNKNAQAWFRPRQVLPLATVLSDWADEGLSIRQFIVGR